MTDLAEIASVHRPYAIPFSGRRPQLLGYGLGKKAEDAGSAFPMANFASDHKERVQ